MPSTSIDDRCRSVELSIQEDDPVYHSPTRSAAASRRWRLCLTNGNPEQQLVRFLLRFMLWFHSIQGNGHYLILIRRPSCSRLIRQASPRRERRRLDADSGSSACPISVLLSDIGEGYKWYGQTDCRSSRRATKKVLCVSLI